jgi:hypothetical protein
MPQFEGSRIVPNSRSHATLVKSQGDSPAERWIIDPALKGLFEYHYAGWPRSHVVIPKGTIVSVGPPVHDWRTLVYKPVLTFAGHGKFPAGVAPYNFMKRFDDIGNTIHDVFEADDFVPGLITREYIEVPLIPNPADVYVNPATAVNAAANPVIAKTALKFYWGCATNVAADFGTANALKEGDFVKAGPYGKFLKWNSASDGAHLIVGQVLAAETDIPPEGWLSWVTPDVEKHAGKAGGSLRDPWQPTAPPTPEGPYYDPDYKWPLTSDYRSPGAWKTHAGVPGLTDGANIATTDRVAKGILPANATEYVLQIDPIAKVDLAYLDVFIDDVKLENTEEDPELWVFDPASNRLTIDVEAEAEDREVMIVYRQTHVIGTPPAWDFVGSIGAARILLKF